MRPNFYVLEYFHHTLATLVAPSTDCLLVHPLCQSPCVYICRILRFGPTKLDMSYTKICQLMLVDRNWPTKSTDNSCVMEPISTQTIYKFQQSCDAE